MDIHKWLDETILPRQAHALPEQLGLAPFLQPKKGIEEGHGRKKRQTKRSTSDSSILDSRPKRRKDPPIEYESEAEQASACSVASIPSRHSSPSNSSSRRYARRPRRKTRLERYDPKPEDAKGRRRQLSGREKRGSRISRRKSRLRPEQLGTSRVQGFHVKNVPQDRLTLRPREKLGIFNQGRASSPVRRRGLPDLVFSEMKFLQKQPNEPEAPRQQGPAVRKRKRDHTKTKQEEISAYFTSTRSALAERSANIQSNRPADKPTPLRDIDPQQHRSTLIDNTIPSIEAAEKSSYLGFGSRGPRHESGSYISWSESVYSPSVVRRKASSPMKARQRSSNKSERDRVEVATENIQQPLTDSGPVNPNLTNPRGEGFKWPPPTPANQLTSRSRSYPADSRSTLYQSSVHPSSLNRRGGADVSPSSAPASLGLRPRHSFTHRQQGVADRLEVRESSRPPRMQQQNLHQPEHKAEPTQRPNFGNIEPQLSTLGRLLRECDSVFNEMKRLDNGMDLQNKGPNEPRNFKTQDDMRRTRRDSTYIMQPESHVQSPVFASYRPRLPDLSRPSIYEEQARRRNIMEDQHYNEPYIRSRDVQDLHVGPHYEDEGWEDAEPEGLQEGEADYGGFIDEVEDTEIGLSYAGEQGEEELEPVDDVVRGGFWRPHKLY